MLLANASLGHCFITKLYLPLEIIFAYGITYEHQLGVQQIGLDILGHPGQVTLGKTHTFLSFSSLIYKVEMIKLPLSDRAVVKPSRIMYVKCLVAQLLSHVQLFVTLWTAACQASLFFTISQSLLKRMSIESVMPSNHLILCCPLLLLPSIFPSIRVSSKELALHILWPKYWSFGFSISPSNEHSGLISFRWTGWISLQSKGLSRVFSNTTVQKHQFFNAQPSLWSNSHTHT